MFILTQIDFKDKNQILRRQVICVSKDVELLKLKVYNDDKLELWDGNICTIDEYSFYSIDIVEEV